LPEETVTYKVEIDDTDLGGQLDAVRQKIDTAIGATAMRSTELPKAQDLLESYPLLGQEFTGAPTGQFAQSLDSNFWPQIAPTQSMMGQNNSQSFLHSMAAQMDEAAESLQMGYTKFTDDLRTVGLLTPPMPYPSQDFSGTPTGRGSYGFTNDLVGGGYIPSFFGAVVDSGFDYTGQITPGEARRGAQYRTEKRFSDFTKDNGLVGGSIAVGAAIGGVIAGPPGALAGAGWG